MINSAVNFQTNDTALANTLALCGVPAPKDERGQPVPQIMIYDTAALRKLGYRGTSVDEAAKQAMKDGKAGVRVFQFEPSPLLDRIVKAHNQAAAWLKAGKNINLPEVEPADVASIVLAANQMRRKMLSAWNIPAVISSDHSTVGARTPEGGWKASGNFSAISVGASDALKSEVRL